MSAECSWTQLGQAARLRPSPIVQRPTELGFGRTRFRPDQCESTWWGLHGRRLAAPLDGSYSFVALAPAHGSAVSEPLVTVERRRSPLAWPHAEVAEAIGMEYAIHSLWTNLGA